MPDLHNPLNPTNRAQPIIENQATPIRKTEQQIPAESPLHPNIYILYN